MLLNVMMFELQCIKLVARELYSPTKFEKVVKFIRHVGTAREVHMNNPRLDV